MEALLLLSVFGIIVWHHTWPPRQARKQSNPQAYHGGEGHSDRGLPIWRRQKTRISLNPNRISSDQNNRVKPRWLSSYDMAFWPQLRILKPNLLGYVCRFFVARFEPISEMPSPHESIFIWTFNNRLFVYGDNHCGMLGLGHNRPLTDGTEFLLSESPLSGMKIVQMSTGKLHIAALTQNGDLYTWGRNVEGQLGTGDFQTYYWPQLVLRNVRQVACGHEHTVVVTFEDRCLVAGCFDKEWPDVFVIPEFAKFTDVGIDQVKTLQCNHKTVLVMDAKGNWFTNRTNPSCEHSFGLLNLPIFMLIGNITAVAPADDDTIYIAMKNDFLFCWSVLRNSFKKCIAVKHVKKIFTAPSSGVVILVSNDDDKVQVWRDKLLIDSTTKSIPDCFALYGIFVVTGVI